MQISVNKAITNVSYTPLLRSVHWLYRPTWRKPSLLTHHYWEVVSEYADLSEQSHHYFHTIIVEWSLWCLLWFMPWYHTIRCQIMVCLQSLNMCASHRCCGHAQHRAANMYTQCVVAFGVDDWMEGCFFNCISIRVYKTFYLQWIQSIHTLSLQAGFLITRKDWEDIIHTGFVTLSL